MFRLCTSQATTSHCGRKEKSEDLKFAKFLSKILFLIKIKKKTFFKSKSNLSRFLQLLISPSLRLYFLVMHVSLPTFSSDAFGVKTGPKNLCRLMFLFFFKKKHVFLQGTINMSQHQVVIKSEVKKHFTKVAIFGLNFGFPFFTLKLPFAFSTEISIAYMGTCLLTSVPSMNEP